MDELARFRLDGRVAVVSGGTGGIGRRLSVAFAGAGARVAVVGRSAEQAGDIAEAISEAGSEALLVNADLVRKEDADRAIERTVERFGRVDALVTAVGGGAGTALYDAEAYPQDEWDRIMDLNLRSDLLITQAAARAMIAGGRGGRILHISSVRGQLGINQGFSAYVAAKGAINALTRQQATEWAKHGITVNAIAPTFVATPQVETLLADEEFRTNLLKRIPIGRIADTDDLVGALLFFCSDASSFVTGQILTLDGGLTATQ
ncbi:MAG TPA: SDR family oxidoreductase [Candidatus Limnocylindria bacterium]|nr:SDR family oxidoreductase [Candidatus Limnocylindria bacterium]